ncbi:MAG: prepilin-type N-terminal cleavage/methylation domain-containing protein [Planctomycetota bacterium]|nr:prepilin-type N-terminal cleavage/methylation domain-containing protein [Planctomycetota bacterium]
MNSRQQAAGSRQCIPGGGGCAHSLPAARCPLPARSAAFTLIEVLVVIGIIVLLIALAIPALALISGNRSVDSAENNLSAMLGRARSDAIGLQVPTGVMFFIDNATRGVMMAEVYDTGARLGDRQVYLELVGDRDFLPLPKGVSAQVVDKAVFATGVRADDGYLGYNVYPFNDPNPTFRYGGVIMFDAQGRLYNPTYGFDFTTSGAASRMGKLFANDPNLTAAPAPAFDPPVALTSGYGVALFDREAFINGSGSGDEDTANRDFQVGGTGAPTIATERGEEGWIDDNSVPLLINRYNGTLVRGE